MTQPEATTPRHGLIWRSCHLLAWLAVALLLAAAGLRIFYHDANNLLICVNAFTRYLYLPAYACAAWAVWQRRWRLAVAAFAIVACHVVWILPDFLRDRRWDSYAGDSAPNPGSLQPAGSVQAASPATLRIFFANVAAGNSSRDAFLAEIAEVDPDIVIFVEYYHAWHRAAQTSPIMRPYVFGTYGPGRPHGFAGEVAVYSKLPLQEHPRIWAAGRMTCAFDVPVDGAPLRLLCLHAPRPTQRAFYDYDGFWKVITPEILALPDPAVVVGDFNATQYSAVYERLTADRLRSAHEDRGRGYATTWPNGAWPVPPIRIDQALLSPGVECVRITEGRGAGSDHKPLILDVQIRGRSASR